MALHGNNADDMIKIVNQNSDYRKITEYITAKDTKLNFDKAKELAKELVLQGYKVEDILANKLDEYIMQKIFTYKIEMNSVLNDKEKANELKLKTIKKLIEKRRIERALALIAGLAATVMILGVKYTDYNNDNLKNNISTNLGLLASEVNSDDYLRKLNIIEQNSTLKIDSETGEYVSSKQRIAEDIVNVCIKDPNLFDVVIYNTYYNISSNRLNTFSEIWNYLQTFITNDEAFASLNAKIANKSFLDYVLEILVKYDKTNEYLPDYQKYLKIIKEYNGNQVYDMLTRESKVILQDMMEKYQEIGLKLYKQENHTIDNLVQEQRDEATQIGGRK